MKTKKKSVAVEAAPPDLWEYGSLACPACYKTITPKNTLCPRCGLDIQKYEDTHCPECEAEHVDDAISCEDCGAEFDD